MNSLKKLLRSMLFSVSLLIAFHSMAQTNTWDGSSDANWNTAANWSLNLVPTTAHDVVIPDNITGTITVNTAAVCNSLTIDGGGADQTLTISGANSLTVSNAITINSGTGFGDIKTLAVNAGTLTCASIDMAAGGFLNGTQLTVSTGTVNVTGDIAIGSGGGLAFNDFTFTDAGTLNVGGSFSGGFFTASTSTVNYNGSNQTIGAYTYNTLNFIGDGVSTFEGGITTNGDFTINTTGNLSFGAFTHSIGGDWINTAGTLDLTGSTIDLNGAGQTIGGANSTTFDNLTLSGSGTKTFGFSTTIQGTLDIATGVVADLGTFTGHTANALSLENVGQASGTWGNSASAAANTNDTFFAATIGVITSTVTGPTTYFSRQTGNWNAAATWSTVTFGDATNNGTFPQAGDIVNIGGAALTVTVNVNSACGSIDFLANDGNSTTLAINNGITLDVSGGINLPRTGFFSGATHTLAVGGGTLNAVSLDFSGGGFFGTSTMTIAAGTATFTGDISTDFNVNFPSIVFSDAGLLQVGGSFTNSTNSTFTASTGTVEYNGNTAQIIGDFTYNNLILSGTGEKTTAGAIDVNGNLTLASGATFTPGAFTHTIAGNWVNNGATFNTTGSTINFDGTTAQSIGGTNGTNFNNITLSGSNTVTFNFSTTISATFDIFNTAEANLGTITTHTSKTLSFDGVGQVPGTWGSTASAAGNTSNTYFTAAATGIVTVTNTIYFTRQTGNWGAAASWSTVAFGNATNTGTFPSTGDIARIGGNLTITVNANADCSFIEYQTGTANTNTVSIAGGNTLSVTDAISIPTNGDNNIFDVGAGTLNVVDLVFSPADGDATNAQFTISTGTATVTGDVTNTGEVDFFGAQEPAIITFSGAGTLQIAGTFLTTATATLTPSTGTVEYNGSSAQTVADFTYNNLTLNNTDAALPALTLSGNTTVTSTLNMTSGIVDMTGFTLSLGSGAASTLNRTASSTTNWMYGGTFERFWPASTAVTSTSGNFYGLFPVGAAAASSYRPVEFNSTVSQTGAGTVSVNHSDVASVTDLSPFYDDGGTDIEVKDNSSFDITNAASGGTYDVSITMTGYGSGTLSDYRLAKNSGPTTVVAVGTHVAAVGSATNPTAGRSGVTSAEIAGDWRMASSNASVTPLPVELIFFDSQLENNHVLLTWATASELNNDRFEVERSLDGLTFEKIATIQGNGTTNELKQYSYRDYGFGLGINYYRLKQVDFDGQFEYSAIILENTDGLIQEEFSIYPNPVIDQISIDLRGIALIEDPYLSLIDYSGKVVFERKLSRLQEFWTLDVSGLQLKHGIFFLRLSSGDTEITRKLIYRH